MTFGQWADDDVNEHDAEVQLRKFLDANPQIYRMEDGEACSKLIFLCSVIISRYKAAKKTNAFALENLWSSVERSTHDLHKALVSLERHLGEDFTHILWGIGADETQSEKILRDLVVINKRAERLRDNFKLLDKDKRNDKFVVLALAEVWSDFSGIRASANQERSPFYLFLNSIYDAYQIGGTPSRNTLQDWLPKQS